MLVVVLVCAGFVELDEISFHLAVPRCVNMHACMRLDQLCKTDLLRFNHMSTAEKVAPGMAGVNAGSSSICTVGKGLGLNYRGYDIKGASARGRC